LPDLLAALAPVVRLFDTLGVAYYVSGSLASSAHGIARASLDVDRVADLKVAHVPTLVSVLEKDYYLDAARMAASVRERRSFNLIHLETMFKLDVFVARDRPFDHEALRRARREALGESHDVRTVPVATAEDTVLAKLEWFKAGGEVFDHQWADIVGVLKVGGPDIDQPYLRHWAAALGVSDLLDRAQSEAAGAA
jgi:hypothetical protein